MSRRFGREVAERLVVAGAARDQRRRCGDDERRRDFPASARDGSRTRLGDSRHDEGPARRSSTLTASPTAACRRSPTGLPNASAIVCSRGVAVQRVEPAGDGWRVVHDGGETTADARDRRDAGRRRRRSGRGIRSRTCRLATARFLTRPMRAVGIAFRTADVPVPLDGFGFLAARNQGVRLLGAFYTSSIVPEHAPPDTAYLRIFLGGSTDPGIATLDEAARIGDRARGPASRFSASRRSRSRITKPSGRKPSRSTRSRIARS